jgi:hypothetical protein
MPAQIPRGLIERVQEAERLAQEAKLYRGDTIHQSTPSTQTPPPKAPLTRWVPGPYDRPTGNPLGRGGLSIWHALKDLIKQQQTPVDSGTQGGLNALRGLNSQPEPSFQPAGGQLPVTSGGTPPSTPPRPVQRSYGPSQDYTNRLRMLLSGRSG